jgi:hypothetical protein
MWPDNVSGVRLRETDGRITIWRRKTKDLVDADSDLLPEYLVISWPQ